MSSSNNVLTIGTFDMLHYGHVDFLKSCVGLGELTVGVNSDEFVQSFKEESPVMSEDERMYAIRQLGYQAILNKSAGQDMIVTEMPNILAVGSDWARRDYLKQIDMTYDKFEQLGIILAYVPRARWYPMSSTEIRRRIRER